MRLALALIAATLGGAAQAQLLPVSQALSPRPLPHGVSRPAVTSSLVAYPGCPGEVTTHTHTVYFDQVNGHTQSGGGLGTLAAPWDNLQALTGNNSGTPTAGYTQILLSTAPGGNGSSPIVPGDLIIVNTGSYGAVTWGAGTAIVNSPAITIKAGAGQTPLFTTISTSEFTGIHLEGLKVQGFGSLGAPLVVISDNHVPLSSSDIILENMDISSASVATGNGWEATSKATWIANARPGIIFQSNFDQTPATTMSCASLVNSHIYEVSWPGLAAVEAQSSNLLVLGNEIDHFYPVGVDFDESNTSIRLNYVHDYVQTSQGYQQYAFYDNQVGDLIPALYQSNIDIENNKSIESIDAGQLFQGAANFFLNSCNDITNVVIADNLHAGGGGSGIGTGNMHDFMIASNSLMWSGTGQNPGINLSQGHCGTTGPRGRTPTNGWVFNNIAPVMNNANGATVQTYSNIIAPGSTGFSVWVYPNVWSEVFVGPTPGSVITVNPLSGQQNLIDGGVGGANPEANEFTAVPAAASFPMSPQPDWTPKAGSPAKTVGAVQLIPPFPDYNGVTPNNSIGALN